MSRGGVLLAAGLVIVIDLLATTRLAAGLAPRMSRSRDGAVRSPLAWALRMIIVFYRAAWSARNAGVCRFEPSCSAYGLEAVRRYGGVRGGLLAARRLLRCQPLSAGGYDPVPVRASTSPDHGRLGVPAGEQGEQGANPWPDQGLDPQPNPPKPTASRCGTRA
ncbi:membrane protein insertion efficiency factor YidD [Candidatus Protofrankia californiensis]|uniref:membrane protein insertion efficiency factor YidD n=1 Tax=Candidatus Protofrankia californiensis TaxID=1839754 RepID=UPI0010417F53|nr:membrane protein insertion efficiency factor YidD [Candidatus Protofrankia californiensis]